MEALAHARGTPFDYSQHSDDRNDTPQAGLCCPDLDQQISQQLLCEEWSSPSSLTHPFSQTQESHISPAAMFLAAFTPPAQPMRQPDDEGEAVAGYVLGPVIGRGGFSTIRRAFFPSGGVVAIKIVKRSDIASQSDPSLARKRLDHETDVWTSLSHEHILPLFSVEHTSYADFYITLYCPAGSLYDILKRDGTPALPLDDAGMMFRQIVRGVRYLHEVAGYVHRDIKLENVLVDEMGVCRVSDFGLTRKIGESDDEEHLDSQDNNAVYRHRSVIHHTIRHAKPILPSRPSILRHGPRRHRTSTPVGDHSPAPVHPAHAFQPGSLPFAAPELLSPQTHGRHHGADPAQDMWALGCLLYALLTGRLPFSDSFEPRLTMKILHGVYDMPTNIGRGASRVLKGCLEHDVRNRWTIAMVDEIAWDIGWRQVDESSVSHPDEFEFIDCPCRLTRHRSRSCSRDFDPPSSRTRRSPSCLSASTSSSLSSRSTSPSGSRPPIACANVGHAVLDLPTTTHLDVAGSAPLSPSSPVERGRSPRKEFLSLANRFAPSIEASTALSDLGREPSRGRQMYSGTDVLDNTARWASALGPNTIAEVTTHLNGMSSSAVEKLCKIQSKYLHHSGKSKSERSKRAESTPPTSTWTHRRSRGDKEDLPSSRLGDSLGVRGAFLREPSAAPIPIVRKKGTRSRSVDYETDSTARRYF